MGRSNGVLTPLGVGVLLLLAGCAGSGTEDAKVLSIGSEEFGLGTGSIVGQVVSEEQAPVVGALVQVDDLAPIAVDETGGFAAHGLAPGEHLVRVGASGYTLAERTIALAEGETQTLQFVLSKIASTEPYVEIFHGRGYSVCDTAYLANFGDNAIGACADTLSGGQDNNVFRHEAAASWRFIITEGTWTPSFADGSDSLRIVHAPLDACSGGSGIQDRSENFCYGAAFGERYTKLEAEPGKTEVNMYYDVWEDKRFLPYPETNFTFHVLAQWTGWGREVLQPHCWWVPYTQNAEHEPGCYGVGISTGISMEIWTSIFHWAKPVQPNECCPTTDYTATEG